MLSKVESRRPPLISGPNGNLPRGHTLDATREVSRVTSFIFQFNSSGIKSCVSRVLDSFNLAGSKTDNRSRVQTEDFRHKKLDPVMQHHISVYHAGRKNRWVLPRSGDGRVHLVQSQEFLEHVVVPRTGGGESPLALQHHHGCHHGKPPQSRPPHVPDGNCALTSLSAATDNAVMDL
jgi:hypothetical protein